MEQTSSKDKIDLSRLPQHVAVIMDGNGRWAKQHGKPRVFGHKQGVTSVRETTECAAELGIKYLTLYAFSTENWRRPQFEVNALMRLLVDTIRAEIDTLNKNDIRLKAIGDLEKLPQKSYEALQYAIENTSANKRMTLILALNYSSSWEIIDAVKRIALDVSTKDVSAADIDDQLFENYLSTNGVPNPELLIRTSGEQRLSNFLLWQMAYSELYFTDIYWPEFRKENFYTAILEFQSRERRFGKTSEQITKN